MTQLVYERPATYSYAPTIFVSRIVNAIFGIIEFFILLRILFEMLGASGSAPFVASLYSVTDSLVAPFVGAFANWNIAGLVLDISAVLALIAYAIIGYLVNRLLAFIFASLA